MKRLLSILLLLISGQLSAQVNVVGDNGIFRNSIRIKNHPILAIQNDTLFLDTSKIPTSLAVRSFVEGRLSSYTPPPASIPTLQQVTTADSSTTRAILLNGAILRHDAARNSLFFGNAAGTSATGGILAVMGQNAAQQNLGFRVYGIGRDVFQFNTGSSVVALGDRAGKFNVYGDVALFGTEAEADGPKQLVFNNGIGNTRFDFNWINTDVKLTVPNSDGALATKLNGVSADQTGNIAWQPDSSVYATVNDLDSVYVRLLDSINAIPGGSGPAVDAIDSLRRDVFKVQALKNGVWIDQYPDTIRTIYVRTPLQVVQSGDSSILEVNVDSIPITVNNLANASLTADGDYYHNWDSHALDIQNIDTLAVGTEYNQGFSTIEADPGKVKLTNYYDVSGRTSSINTGRDGVAIGTEVTSSNGFIRIGPDSTTIIRKDASNTYETIYGNDRVVYRKKTNIGVILRELVLPVFGTGADTVATKSDARSGMIALPYKEWAAVITFNGGTNHPTINAVLLNQFLDSTITINYNGQDGFYLIDSYYTEFTLNKTTLTVSNAYDYINDVICLPVFYDRNNWSSNQITFEMRRSDTAAPISPLTLTGGQVFINIKVYN